MQYMIDFSKIYFKTLALIGVSVLLYACNERANLSDDALKQKIIKCLSEKGKDIDNKMNLIDIFCSLESDLMQKGLLSGNDKLSYERLFKRIRFKQLNKFNFSNVPNIEYLSYPSLNTNILSCTWYFIEEDSLNNSMKYNDYHNSLKKINQTGEVSNWELNFDLLESTPEEGFDNIIYRYPLILIVYQNLSNDL